MFERTLLASALSMALLTGCATTSPALTATPPMKPAANLGELTVPPLSGKAPAYLTQGALYTMAAALEVKPDGADVSWQDHQGVHHMKILVTSTEGDTPCRMLAVDGKQMTACRLSTGWMVR